MQYRVFYPFFLELFHRQPFKELLFSLKIGFEGRNKQTFSKATGTAQKIITPGLYHLINQCCFINIEKAPFTDFLKILYPDRIDFIAHILLFRINNRQTYKYKDNIFFCILRVVS